MQETSIETERLIISSIAKSNYEIVTKLYADIKNNAYATGVFNEITENEVEKRTSFDEKIKTGLNLGANLKDSGSFIGYLKLSVNEDEGLAWLYTFIVVPEKWREGFGTEFINAVERYVRSKFGVCFIGLSVADANVNAKKFWESLGYSINKTMIKAGFQGNELSKINIYVKLF